MPERAEIVAKLNEERETLIARYRSLPAEALTTACTDSEVDGAERWTAKDHLAHLAMIERAFQQMIRRSIAGEGNPVRFRGATREEIIAGVHANNQDNVDTHRGDDLDTLLADLDAARNDTFTLLDELTDEQLAEKVPGAPWADGTAGGVIITNAFHEMQHWAWVQEGLAKES